jgi:predicted nucleotidyltransferase
MAKRQPLPDVLGDLLSEKHMPKRTPEYESKQHNTSMEEQCNTGVTEHHQGSIATSQIFEQQDQESSSPVEDAEVGKTKATFYLSREITQALEDTWLHLRRRAGKGKSASKSILVEAALRIMLPKLLEKGVDLQKSSTTAYQHTGTP